MSAYDGQLHWTATVHDLDSGFFIVIKSGGRIASVGNIDRAASIHSHPPRIAILVDNPDENTFELKRD